MSTITYLGYSIDICCPNCDEMMEIDDVDISMTIEHHDEMGIKDQCSFEIECDDCGKTIKITPEAHIGVKLVE